ncbi:hypothetical protein HQN87_04720 [Paenibacillus tritici]|uniref:Uncharacterized protein n=1 Tax=Paenibacillus tritici TaxID=1873425 RepID=A0ABX2DLB9_9BACL|nr:hypothetical protein [Paenibacillus tritici]NQX44626.1 hypothetical protein [Paenibacillus tritici]
MQVHQWVARGSGEAEAGLPARRSMDGFLHTRQINGGFGFSSSIGPANHCGFLGFAVPQVRRAGWL